MNRLAVVGLVCCLALAWSAAADAGNAGNPADGKTKSLACQACHISVNPASEVPHLVGQRASYLTKQLNAFKKGDRKNDIMSAIANQLSDADIADLAAYWSAEAPGSDAQVPAATLPIRNTKMKAVPKDFPKGYVVFRSEFSAEDNSISKSYANAAAVAAVKAKKPLGDGSVILVVNYTAKLDDKKQPVRGADGEYAVDKATSYSGMEARPNWGKDIPELLRNDNWNYGLFGADKAPRPEWNQAVCLACHKPVAADSYMFTFRALQAKVLGK
jgi:cytochrome c553